MRQQGIPLAGKQAVEIGAGGSLETPYLASLGMKVLAIDSSSLGMNHLWTNVIESSLDDPQVSANVEMLQMDIREVDLPLNWMTVARFTLPYISPEDFPAVWENVATNIVHGGLLVADFFGPDHVAKMHAGRMSLHSPEMLMDLLKDSGFELVIKSDDGRPFRMKTKPRDSSSPYVSFMDIIRVVAQKRV